MDCKQCGEGFEAKRSTALYCSAKCRKLAFQVDENAKPENAKENAKKLSRTEYNKTKKEQWWVLDGSVCQECKVAWEESVEGLEQYRPHNRGGGIVHVICIGDCLKEEAKFAREDIEAAKKKLRTRKNVSAWWNNVQFNRAAEKFGLDKELMMVVWREIIQEDAPDDDRFKPVATGKSKNSVSSGLMNELSKPGGVQYGSDPQHYQR